MAVTATGSSTDDIYLNSKKSSSTASSSGGNSLTLTDFYRILAAQLKNQSMYDSTDNSQYIAQMVQFAMLSQMQTMTNSVDSSTAVSMIGKKVSLSSTDSNGTTSTTSGTVDSVGYKSGAPYLKVGGTYYPLSDVTSVQSSS